MQKTVESYKAPLYREIYLITEWKDGCVYKTKSIGFAYQHNKTYNDPDKYLLSSISTKLTRNPTFTMEPFLE